MCVGESIVYGKVSLSVQSLCLTGMLNWLHNLCQPYITCRLYLRLLTIVGLMSAGFGKDPSGTG